VRKYLSMASFVFFLFFLARIGTKDSMLISRPSHAVNQEEAEIVVRTPRIIIKKNRA
jgi:hypothetical protein